MSKRTVFTTVSPLPAGISREVVLDFLHNHVEMIDLNPLVTERHPITPPMNVSADEKDCIWYSLTDKIEYLPGGKVSGDISYTCAFHDLSNGIQTHCRAPLGVDIREKWTLCGSLPGEPAQPVELGLGAPSSGLYIREDCDLRCNILMTSFVKKNLKRAHATLVKRLVENAKAASAPNDDGSAQPETMLPLSPPYSPTRSFRAAPASASSSSSAAAAATASSSLPHYVAHISYTGSSIAKPESLPPQLGSPFISGYQPGRAPSIRYHHYQNHHRGRSEPVVVAPASSSSFSSSETAPSSYNYNNNNNNNNKTHKNYYSHDDARSQLPSQKLPSVLHAPMQASYVQKPSAPLHYSLPPPPRHQQDPTLYPSPLRIRNLSVSSCGQTSSSSSRVSMAGTVSSLHRTISTATTSSTSSENTLTTVSHEVEQEQKKQEEEEEEERKELQVARDQEQHPDYPQLSPYRRTSDFSLSSSVCSSPDEPKAPLFQVVVVEEEEEKDLAGSSSSSSFPSGGHHHREMIDEIDYPDVLRPGAGGMGARLSRPFIAELQ